MAHRPLDWSAAAPERVPAEPSAIDRWPSIGAFGPWLAAQLLAERERWILWLPVGLGCGIAVYFALPYEPPFWLGFATLVPLLLALAHERWRADGGSPGAALALLALTTLVLGFAVDTLRTHTVEVPMLAKRGAHVVEARVVLVEERKGGRRLGLDDLRVEGLAPDEWPAWVRVTVRGAGPPVRPGDRVRLRAMLMPPSPPVEPRGFDFARQAFFKGLGAVGYALGSLEVVARGEASTWRLTLARVRQYVAAEVRAAVPGASGAVAIALLTGLRGAIPDDVWSDMQAAGIAHLLAISGLHLGLVAGTLFFAARIGLALIPPLALRLPGKKVAAAVALVGALVYLFLTGATVPTQRAFMTTALMLLAVMVDRNPFSMRLVAWAALAVLLSQPESLLGPSFQMSFAAVVALIAAYETGVAKRPHGAGGLDWRLALYVGGVALTTVVATFATAPFAVYHFGRLPTYGIVANLIAVPLTAFWVMPIGLLGLLLLPFGLGGVCFVLMGQGIDVILAVAGTVADWPGAAVRIARPPLLALVLAAVGGLWLCLWQGRWRRLGLLGVLAAIVVGLLHQPADLLVDASGRLFGVRQGGRLAVSDWYRDSWVTKGWLRAVGVEEAAPWPAAGEGDEGLRCDALGCVVTKGGVRVALALRPEALAEDCALTDLVISYPRVERCPGAGRLIGPRALRAAGGLALWLDDGRIETLSVSERRGDRPWTRP